MTNYSLSQIRRQIKYLKRDKDDFKTLFWIFLDDDNISNIEVFLKILPERSFFGLIIRGKSKKIIYSRAKRISKLCKRKKVPYYISDYSDIALITAAGGVHYSSRVKQQKKYKNLKISCSFHGKRDIRRVKYLLPDLIFISPVFKTTSGKQKKPLALQLLNLYIKNLKYNIAALGGIDLKNIRKLRNRNISCVGGVSIVRKIIDY